MTARTSMSANTKLRPDIASKHKVAFSAEILPLLTDTDSTLASSARSSRGAISTTRSAWTSFTNRKVPGLGSSSGKIHWARTLASIATSKGLVTVKTISPLDKLDSGFADDPLYVPSRATRSDTM